VPTSSPSAEAQSALDNYWVMIKRLLAAPDPTDPELAQRAVDPSLSTTKDLLTTRQASHQVVQFDGVPYHVDTRVSSVVDATAAFSGCIVDGGRVVDADTGAVINDKVSTSRIQGSLVNVEGHWKMQRFDVLRKADGEIACDALA
jgi:hypothetical protein